MIKISEENKTKVSALLAAFLVVSAGYLVYRNFSRVEEQISKEPATVSSTTEGEKMEFKAEETKGAVIALESSGTGGETSVWQARPIASGSLTGKTYTVQSGDTLWEIANGRYGSGFEWTKILNANKDKIGFLADGSQALITPGQVLVLPD